MLTIFVLVISLELFVAFSLFFEIRLPQRLIFFGDDNVADLDVGGVVGLETGRDYRVFCADICIVDIVIIIAHHINIFVWLVLTGLRLSDKLVWMTVAVSLNGLLRERGDLRLCTGLFPSLFFESEAM